MHTLIRLAAWAAILAGLVMVFMLGDMTIFTVGVILTLVGVGVLCWSNSVRYHKEDEAKRESYEQRRARAIVDAEQTLKRAKPVVDRLQASASSPRNNDSDDYYDRQRRMQDEQLLQMTFTNAAILDIASDNTYSPPPAQDDDSCRYNQSDSYSSPSYDSPSSNDSCSSSDNTSFSSD